MRSEISMNSFCSRLNPLLALFFSLCTAIYGLSVSPHPFRVSPVVWGFNDIQTTTAEEIFSMILKARKQGQGPINIDTNVGSKLNENMCKIVFKKLIFCRDHVSALDMVLYYFGRNHQCISALQIDSQNADMESEWIFLWIAFIFTLKPKKLLPMANRVIHSLSTSLAPPFLRTILAIQASIIIAHLINSLKDQYSQDLWCSTQINHMSEFLLNASLQVHKSDIVRILSPTSSYLDQVLRFGRWKAVESYLAELKQHRLSASELSISLSTGIVREIAFIDALALDRRLDSIVMLVLNRLQASLAHNVTVIEAEQEMEESYISRLVSEIPKVSDSVLRTLPPYSHAHSLANELDLLGASTSSRDGPTAPLMSALTLPLQLHRLLRRDPVVIQAITLADSLVTESPGTDDSTGTLNSSAICLLRAIAPDLCLRPASMHRKTCARLRDGNVSASSDRHQYRVSDDYSPSSLRPTQSQPTRLLLLGEGDFAFTVALRVILEKIDGSPPDRFNQDAENFRSMDAGAGMNLYETTTSVRTSLHVTATTLLSESALYSRYRRARSNVMRLTSTPNTDVIFNVDATKYTAENWSRPGSAAASSAPADISDLKYDVVMFNFPFADEDTQPKTAMRSDGISDGSRDRDSSGKIVPQFRSHWVARGRHMELIRGVFDSAHGLLRSRETVMSCTDSGADITPTRTEDESYPVKREIDEGVEEVEVCGGVSESTGRVIFTLLLTQAVEWEVEEVGRASGFALEAVIPFDEIVFARHGYVRSRSYTGDAFPGNSRPGSSHLGAHRVKRVGVGGDPVQVKHSSASSPIFADLLAYRYEAPTSWSFVFKRILPVSK